MILFDKGLHEQTIADWINTSYELSLMLFRFFFTYTYSISKISFDKIAICTTIVQHFCSSKVSPLAYLLGILHTFMTLVDIVNYIYHLFIDMSAINLQNFVSSKRNTVNEPI